MANNTSTPVPSAHVTISSTHDEKEPKLGDGRIDEALATHDHNPTSSTTDEEKGVIQQEDGKASSTEKVPQSSDGQVKVSGARLAVVTVAILLAFFLVALVSLHRRRLSCC